MADTVPLTDEQYNEEGGTRCPFCRTDDIRCGIVETNDGQPFSDLSCNICLREWREWFKLDGYSRRCATCRDVMLPGEASPLDSAKYLSCALCLTKPAAQPSHEERP